MVSSGLFLVDVSTGQGQDLPYKSLIFIRSIFLSLSFTVVFLFADKHLVVLLYWCP